MAAICRGHYRFRPSWGKFPHLPADSAGRTQAAMITFVVVLSLLSLLVATDSGADESRRN